MKSFILFKSSIIIFLSFFALTFQSYGQIKADKTSGCAPLMVSLQLENTAFESVIWMMGDGQTANAATPTILFEKEGKWDVSAILTKSDGNKDTLIVENMISVTDKPSANFEVNSSLICLNNEVFFTNLSENATDFQWSFGDGNQSSDENPIHTYREAGVYSISLLASAGNDCQDIVVKERFIEVAPAAEYEISASAYSQCLGNDSPINFSIAAAAQEVEWDFGDGNVQIGNNVEYIYPKKGEYGVKVSYKSENGCSNVITLAEPIKVVDIKTPEIIVQNSKVCLGEEITLKANHPDKNGFKWEIGEQVFEGKEINVKLNQPGAVDVSLFYENEYGCISEIHRSELLKVEEVNTPVLDVTQFKGCAPFNFSAKNSTPEAAKYSWKVNGTVIEGAELNYTFQDAGDYQITSITEYAGGCIIEKSLDQKVTVFKVETNVKSTSWAGCAPLSTNLILLNAGASNVIWQSGSGDSISGKSAELTFENPGTYYPSVSYINSEGCEITYQFEEPIVVNNSTIEMIEPELIESCTYTEVYFSGQMGHEYWHWNFGDGSTSEEQNPVHSYSKAGKYEVSLTTLNKSGCETTIEKYNIIEIPDLEVNTEFVTESQEECGYFKVSASADIQGGQSAEWFYNDNQIGSGANVNLSFITLDDVSLTLKIGSNGGCNTSKSILIPNPWKNCENPEIEEDAEESEEDSPIGKFSFSSCNLPYTLDLVNPLPDIRKIEWRFDGDSVHAKSKFSHTFTTPGVHTIGYKAVIDKDSILTVEDYITVNIAIAIIDFDYKIEKICEGFNVKLTPSNPDYQNYKWKINNKPVELSESGNYYIDKEGLYSVSLTAEGQKNCEATKIKNIFVGDQENQFDYAQVLCFGEGITVSHDLVGFRSISWEMGNGELVNSFEEEYFYPEAGIYEIKMKAVDYEGCEYTLPLPTTVEIKKPVAKFSANKTQGCGETTIQFKSESKDAMEWFWDFGNGETSTLENPKMTFAPGNYSVSLKIFNGECADSIVQSNFIQIEKLTSDFSFKYDQTCLPLTISFQDESVNATKWLWEFGDGNVSTEQNPTHTYYELPQSNVKLTVENASGCKQSSKQLLDFIFSADFQVDANQICLGSGVAFSAVSDDAVKWLWDFGDGNSSTKRNPTHLYENEGIYSVRLIAENATGCTDTVTKAQFIEVSPYKADFKLKESIQNTCVPVQVEFEDLSKGAISYFWNFGDGKTSRVANPVHLYNKVGEFDVILLITNKLGCQDTLKKEAFIKVNGPETKFAIEEKIVCLPKTANFTDISKSAVSWQWIFGDGNTSNEQNPKHLYEKPGTYEVMLIAENEQGCEQIYKMDGIKVLPTPNVDFDLTVSGECYPVEVSLTNNSDNLLNPSYLWDFGDGQTSTEPNPSIVFHKTGEFNISLTVQNDNGCPVTVMHDKKILVRDTTKHHEADLNQILVENNRVHFEIEPYYQNNISHYNVYRDSPRGFNLLQTINVGSQANHRILYDDQTCRPQDMSHEYIFQAVSFCEDTVKKEQLTIFNTMLLKKMEQQKDERLINWNPSKGFSVDNQRIFRKFKGELQWEEIAVLESNALSFRDEEDLCPGIYEYRIGVFQQNTLRSISNFVEFEVTDEIYKNQRAEIKNSTVMETGEVFIEWSISPEGKGRITSFEIHRSENGGEFVYFDSVEPHEQFYIDSESDTENNTYDYQVKVINDCAVDTKNSDRSNTVLLQKDVQFRKYELKWNAFKGWEDGVKKYIIQRLNENGEWETVEEVSGDQLKTIIRDVED
ncbi:PKD domain-containing protein [Marivirga sp.]|uniref:PKD domain-containing protein n=1 Tax=Marivirga sp. TaxID=2018662 RepID=UPI002D7E4594|nr:PKD domain-containing protein [Marivirga sp.]HET8861372.1 PKD domain-containing protein [Marivirga sp.]